MLGLTIPHKKEEIDTNVWSKWMQLIGYTHKASSLVWNSNNYSSEYCYNSLNLPMLDTNITTLKLL